MSDSNPSNLANPSVIIIGAGAAGLIAARTLEAAGHAPLLLDAADAVGGRLRTDLVEGFRLDRGFQVLLTEYPEVRRYLDLAALDVRAFRPGGRVHTRQLDFRFVDPLREPAQLFRSALSPVGTLSDKVKLAQLGLRLFAKKPEECFTGYEEMTTLQYLWDQGFSEQIVERFFRPFFGGIFLEQTLETPAAMFRFILKMFGQGKAVLPAAGIQAVAEQLRDGLERTEIRLHTRAVQVTGNEVRLDDGSTLTATGGIIIACPPERVLPQLAGAALEWKSTTNLYYYSSRRLRENRLINLVSDPTSTINTFSVLDEVTPTYKPESKAGSLISVTLKQALPEGLSGDQVEQDLLRHSGLPNDCLSFLHRYDVVRALPSIDRVAFSSDPTHCRVTDRIFLAGDHQLNGSLDAAMRSGRLAAEGLLLTGALR